MVTEHSGHFLASHNAVNVRVPACVNPYVVHSVRTANARSNGERLEETAPNFMRHHKML